jgi:hypothetical protein
MQPRLHFTDGILISQKAVDANILLRLVIVGHLFILILVILLHFIILQHANDGLVIAFAAELEECAAFAVFGVRFEIALFDEKWQEVEILLQTSLVCKVAEDLLLAARRCGCNALAAVRALGDLVSFEETVPVLVSLPDRRDIYYSVLPVEVAATVRLYVIWNGFWLCGWSFP